MPDHTDASIDLRLRALTRQAFEEAMAARRRQGRLGTRRRLTPTTAALGVVVVALLIAAVLLPLRFHQAGRGQAPSGQASPAPHETPPTAGPLPARAALDVLDSVTGFAVDASGNLYLAEGWLHRVVKVTPDGVPSLLAGPAEPGATPREGGPAATGIFGDVVDVAVDAGGDVFVLDAALGVRRIGVDGRISTLARAGGSPLFAAGGSPGGSIAVTASGTVYVACADCHPPGSPRDSGGVYAISTSGSVRVVASGHGTVTGPPSGATTNRPAGTTLVSSPLGVAVDARGNVFIADTGNNRVREIAANGAVSTVAGSDGVAGDSGDGGPAAQARLNHPVRIAVDAAGDLFILDSGNGRLREVSGGVIRTLSGPGAPPSRPSTPFSAVAGRVFFTGLTAGHSRYIWSQAGSIGGFQEGA